MTIESAKTDTSTTLDQTSWTQVNSMTLTPGAGNFLCIFSMVVEFTGSPGGNTLGISVYVDGVPQSVSYREIQDNSSLPNMTISVCTHAYVQPGAAEVVDIKYQVDGGSMTGYSREIVLLPAPGTNYNDTDVAEDTIAGSWTTLDTMIRTPVSGNYLLVFTTYCRSASNEVVGFRVNVDGSAVPHTERRSMIEDSGVPTTYCIMIACEVNVNGSQVVKIDWARISGSGSQSCYERGMTLIGKAAAQILEVTGTVTDNDTTTTDKQIDDMLIADPGEYDFLVIFSAYQYLGTLGAPGSGPLYSIREGGIEVASTQREFFHEDSLDNVYMSVFCAGKITVTPGTDDLQIYWKGSSTDSRDIFTRTMLAVMEATYKLEGTTYNNTSEILGSVDCYLYKDNLDNTLTFVDHVVSHASLGTFTFTGLQDNDPNYLIVFIKDNGSNVFDCTDHNLTPVAE